MRLLRTCSPIAMPELIAVTNVAHVKTKMSFAKETGSNPRRRLPASHWVTRIESAFEISVDARLMRIEPTTKFEPLSQSSVVPFVIV